jgi:2-polyprenyl-6-methoxyphenol hydroxylase-like FAD-dependent oxidoreductase
MYPTWTSPALPTWERDGVVLVGDAAHALPPSSGQGSSQALEDVEAFVLFLAHYLRRGGENDTQTSPGSQKEAIRAAAKQYTTLRQPRVRNILEFAQKTQNTKRQMGLFQEYSMYIFMKLIGEIELWKYSVNHANNVC